jgi:hypothetical protein
VVPLTSSADTCRGFGQDPLAPSMSRSHRPTQPKRACSVRCSLAALATHAAARAARVGPYIYPVCGGFCPRAVDQPLLDVCGQAVEGLVDVDVALCRDLEERDAEFVCERLTALRGDGALLFPVALVANEDLVDAFGGVLLDVGEPRADVCGRVSRR